MNPLALPMRWTLLVLMTFSMLACQPAVEVPTRSEDEGRAIVEEYCKGIGLCHWPEEKRDEVATAMCLELELRNVVSHPLPRCVDPKLDWYECMNELTMCTDDIGGPGGPCTELADIWHDDECFCALHTC